MLSNRKHCCQNVCAHYLSFFHLRFWCAPKHFSSHDLWPNGYYHNYMFSVAIKIIKYLFLAERADCHQCLCNMLRELQRDSRLGQSENRIWVQHLYAFLLIRPQYLKIIYHFRLILYAYYAFLEYSSSLRPKAFDKDLSELPGPSQKEGDVS